jgi:type I restriction enzyme S subunit
MALLPPGWTTASLGDLCDRVEKVDPLKWTQARDFGYFDIGSINNETHSVTDFRSISSSKAPSRARQLVNKGDVLFSTVRTYLENIAIVPNIAGNTELIASTGFSVLRARIGIDPRFLFYRCLASDVLGAMNQLQQGTSYPAIRDQDLKAFVTLVPPTKEQVRIADEVERRLSHIRAAEFGLRHVSLQIERAVRSTINTAITTGFGISRAGAISDRMQAKAFERHETLPQIAEHWAWLRLGDVLREPMRNGRSGPTAPEGSGVRTYTITAVTKRDFGLHNTKWAVGEATDLTDLLVKNGDIFVQRSNTPELVGSSALYRGRDDAAIFPDLLIRLRPVEDLLPEWLEIVLRWGHTRSFLRSVASGLSSSMPKIDQTKIGRVAVPLPPIEEQKAIVAELNRRLSLIDAAGRTVEHQRQSCIRLRRSVLGAAFAGRLVSQSPDDEPAAALLDRIRAERETAGKPSKPVKDKNSNTKTKPKQRRKVAT